MKLLKLLCLSISILAFSFATNAKDVGHTHNENSNYKIVEQHNLFGEIKYINMSANGEVLNVNDVYGMTGSGRLNEINARYTCNTAAIQQQGGNARLESNNINKENVETECRKFLSKHSERLGINPANLKLYNIMVSDNMFVVVFVQKYGNANAEIRNSFVRMYVFPDGKIQTFSSMYYGDIYDNGAVNDTITIRKNTIKNAALVGLAEENSDNQYIVKYGLPVILPIFNGNGYTYKYVIEADVELPGMELYKAYIDAYNHELLQRNNLVFHTVDVKVDSKHFGDDPNAPMVTQPLKNLKIKIEGISDEKTTNSSGMLKNLPDDVIGKKFTTNLSGNYAVVKKVIHPATSGGVDYSYEGTITADGILMYDSNNYDNVMRTIYNNVGTVRNYYATLDPNSSGVGKQFPCYAQIIENPSLLESKSLEFNAYASGDASLTFLCANHNIVFMAKLNKVAYHEYGHSMVHSKYVDAGQNGGMRCKFANEANADITAAFITENPRVFDGVVKTGEENWALTNNLFRTCENNFMPANLVGEAHEDSQLLSGAFWDFRKSVENFNDVKKSVHFAKEYVPDGYTTESVFANWFDALVRATDRNKSTDEAEFEHNFTAIYNAFNKHQVGFNMLVNERFRHINVEDQSDASQAIPVSCDILDFATPKVLDEVYVNYYTHLNSETKSVLLTRQNTSTGNTYSGEIPAQAEASRVFYYFTYKDPFSGYVDRINRDFFCFVGYADIHKTDCETANGWSIKNSNNNINGFSLTAPPLTYQLNSSSWGQILYSPGFTTSGTKCWATNTKVSYNAKGNQVSESIKDTSTIVSSTFTITDYSNVFLTYQKYHVCVIGDNSSPNGLFVEVSFDGGNTWKRVQTFKGTNKPNNWEWQREYVNLTSYKDATEDFSNIQVRFISYANNSSIGLTVLIDDIALLGSNNPNGIEDTPFINGIEVSPSPVSNEAKLKFPNAVVNPEISVLNTLGIEVINMTLQGEYNFTNLNTVALANGVYFLKVVSGGKIYQTKLVIAR